MARVGAVGLPGAEADQHLELSVLADVPGRAVDGTHEAAEVMHSALPVFIRAHFSLLGTFKVHLRLFCQDGKNKREYKSVKGGNMNEAEKRKANSVR